MHQAVSRVITVKYSTLKSAPTEAYIAGRHASCRVCRLTSDMMTLLAVSTAQLQHKQSARLEEISRHL